MYIYHIIANVIILRIPRTRAHDMFPLYFSGQRGITLWENVKNHGFFSNCPELRPGIFLWGSGKCPNLRIWFGARRKRRNWGVSHLPVFRLIYSKQFLQKTRTCFLTGFSSFPEMVVDPSAFWENAKKLRKSRFIFRPRLGRSRPRISRRR